MSAPVSHVPHKRVLPTLNADGTRNNIRPRLYAGRLYRVRRWVALALLVSFAAVPFVRIQGKPAILLNVVEREFTLFGRTFLPTDGALLMLLMLSIFVGVFWATALFGRAWCGYGCPQTVYMEFVFRPIERLFEGPREQQLRIDQARQLERTRIAREMHDVLAHRISLVSMHAGALEFRAESVGDEVARSAAVIRTSAHQALQDLREVIGILRTETNDDTPERPQPTLDDVPGLIEESQQAGMHIAVQFSVAETNDGLPLSVGRTAYRIVQEGLTNARKHAPGTAVTVALDGRPGPGLTIEIRSRCPISPRPSPQIPGSGQGLVGLAERTDLAGGRLEHGSLTNGDFQLRAWLPWPA